MPKTLLYACVGEIDPAEAIPALGALHDAEVVAVVIDLDHGRAADGLRARALTAGAVRCHVIDGRDTFAAAFVRPAFQAGALAGEWRAVLGALACPFVAQSLARVARLEHADMVAHGETGAQAGRIAVALGALEPSLEVVALPGLQAAAASPPPPAVRRADRAASVQLAFARGVPVTLNGIAMPLAELLESLGTMAAAQGLPGRGVLTPPVIPDGPALAMVQAAHGALQQRVLPADARVADAVALDYAAAIDRGEWFGPMRPALDAYVDAIQSLVHGVVHLTLADGAWRVDRVEPAPADAPLEPVLK